MGTQTTTPVRRMGLGLAAIGRPAYITSARAHDLGDPADRSVEAMRQRTHHLLGEAWELGIRYIDVARSYGEAEEFLGSWLRLHPERRAHLIIGSKWGYEYRGAWKIDSPVQERKEHSLRMFEKQWTETVAALGATPNIYLVHSLTPESPVLGDSALLDRLRTLAESGVSVGFSSSGPRQAEVIETARALPDSPFTAVQATWNLLEPSAEIALRHVHDAGWQVIIKEALANGRLAPGGNPAVDALARHAGQTTDRFALGAALANSWADIVLSGAVTSAQLRSNLRASPPRVEEEQLAALREDRETYWQERSARPWT